SGTKRIANRSRWVEQSWTVRRWPARRRARRSRRSIMSATRSGGWPRRRPDVSRLRAVLFDVDGTLLDTLDAWVRAFDAGLAAIRRPSMTGSEAAQWIGTPIETIYKERCGLAGDDLVKAVRVFQQVEAESVHEGMRAYPGIPDALAALRAWKLAAVTNKRHDTTVEASVARRCCRSSPSSPGAAPVRRRKPFPIRFCRPPRDPGSPPQD